MPDLKPVLKAQLVHLCVLAPRAYYDRFQLGWLQQEISQAPSGMNCSGYRMDFCFQSMKWPEAMTVSRALQLEPRPRLMGPFADSQT
jgi:hypothetical protein